MATVSIQEYEKALVALEKAITITTQQKDDEDLFNLNRDGSIQRFEFCVELAWKVAAKELGSASRSPKLVLREMLQSHLIQDFQMWFDFIDARNKSSHTYDQVIAQQVYEVVQRFLPEGYALLDALKKL